MLKHKKAIIIISIIILTVTTFVLLINYSGIGKEVVYESAELRKYKFTRIQIRDGTGLFEFPPKTGFNYEILVTKPNFWGDVTLLRKEFHYNRDEPLCKEDVDVYRFDDHVGIMIYCKEDTDSMYFECYY